MARKSSAARAAEDNDVDLDFSERAGFLTGKAARLADWLHRKEKREFEKLVRKLKRQTPAYKAAAAAGRARNREKIRGRARSPRVRAQLQERRRSAKFKAYLRGYNQRPDVKKRRCAYKSQPHAMERSRAKSRERYAATAREKSDHRNACARDRRAKVEPEVAAQLRARWRAYQREWAAKPANREKKHARWKDWYAKDGVRAALAEKRRAYRQTPEARARANELRRTPEYRAKRAAYRARPEVKAMGHASYRKSQARKRAKKP